MYAWFLNTCMLIVCEAFCGFHLNFRENVKIELGWIENTNKNDVFFYSAKFWNVVDSRTAASNLHIRAAKNAYDYNAFGTLASARSPDGCLAAPPAKSCARKIQKQTVFSTPHILKTKSNECTRTQRNRPLRFHLSAIFLAFTSGTAPAQPPRPCGCWMASSIMVLHAPSRPLM